MKVIIFKKGIFLLFSLLFFLITANSFAHFGSKGPYGGSINCGTIDDTNAVYLGSQNGGVFASTTKAVIAWSAKPVGLKSGKITALGYAGKYLYAGTADSGIFIFNGFVGSDRYWNKINNGLTNKHITSLLVVDSVTVIAGTDTSGIFVTSDKGATWTAANNGVHHKGITGIVRVGNRVIHISDGGVWASDDSTQTWIDFNDLNTDHVQTDAVSYNKTTNELMIFNSGGLWITSGVDTVMTPAYTSVSTGLPANTIVRSIANNGTTWYLATDKGVFTSPSGAISWTAENTGLATLDVTTVIPFRTFLIAGTINEGIFKSNVSSISWTSTNTGFNNLETYSLATSGTNVVVEATEKGVFVTRDLATTYKRANNGLTDSLHVVDLVFQGTNLYAATLNDGVFMSADTGTTWVAYNSGLANMPLKKLAVHGTTLYLICDMGDVYENSGSGWNMIQSGLPMGAKPTSFAFYSNKILLGTLGKGVFSRPLSGGSWTAINTGLLDTNVTSVTASDDKIFAGTDGSGVFASDTAAVSWSATAPLSIAHTVTMGLNGTKVQAMAFNKGYVFASYKGGLLATSDNGTTWIQGGNQFNLPSFTDVNKIDFVTARVFVTTENNCIYSNALSELPVIVTGINNNTLASNKQMAIVPNPNRGSFVINANNASFNKIEVIIFDYSGRKIDQFLNINTGDQLSVSYPSGVYFVQVKTENNVSTQKIIIQ